MINQSVLEVCNSLNSLNIVTFELPPAPYRIKEQPCTITDEQMERVKGVITAHNLMQYNNVFYGIGLHETSNVWLDILIEVGDRDLIYNS